MAVCIGGDCRKRSEHADLEPSLRCVADVTPVRCLGVCHSPVAVVLDRRGDHAVVERIRTPKQRRDLVAFVRGDAPSKRLAKRLVTGSRRRKALVRLAKRLPPDRSDGRRLAHPVSVPR